MICRVQCSTPPSRGECDKIYILRFHLFMGILCDNLCPRISKYFKYVVFNISNLCARGIISQDPGPQSSARVSRPTQPPFILYVWLF